ncbi:MAG: hypothetical protein ACM3ZQ_03215 [Bacillota bacterium]
MLKPAIASYSGAANKRLRERLTEDLLAVIEQVATSSVHAAEISPVVISDLVEMHVLSRANDQVRLNTAVFLEDDIRNVSALTSELGRGLAEKLVSVGSELNNCSPEIKSFLGGVVGVSQGLSKIFRDEQLAVDWKSYTGRYAQTKVDFDLDCDAYHKLSPDWQIKSTLQGERYTAVFIGPGGGNFQSAIYEIGSLPDFKRHLARYLTDAYGQLLAGEITNETLVLTAEAAGIFAHGQPKPVLVTKELFHRYLPTVERVAEASAQYYLGSLSRIFDCLQNTACGQLGVPPQNMIMHFWRYSRRALAKELYAAGFLTDNVPAIGSITVFYDNGIDDLKRLL